LNSKKWLYGVIVGTFIILLLHFVFLYKVDTYSIINVNKGKTYTIPNQRFLIAEYLLSSKPKGYDTFIFGSSRVGYINPLKIENKKAYNMTYGEGIPHEHLLFLKLLLKNNITIKEILVGLDDFSPQISFSEHDNSFGSKLHYKALGISKFQFYSFYFLRTIRSADIKHFKKKYLGYQADFSLNEHIYNTIFNQEVTYQNSKYVNNNTTEHNNNPAFTVPTINKGNNLKGSLQDIQDIIELCKKNNIKYTFFINPIHKTTYNALDIHFFNNFKKELSYITDYYDFSLPSIINNNNQYWNETSHYSLLVGDMILNRIYDNNKTIENFGKYISIQKKGE